MAKEDLRSRKPGLGMDLTSPNIGHVRPETKPIINEGLAPANNKPTQVIPGPGAVSPNSGPAGPEA